VDAKLSVAREKEKRRSIEPEDSPKKSPNYISASLDADRSKSNRKPINHLRLVGNENSIGQFKSGLSVPKSRPTVFWEPQIIELKYDSSKLYDKKPF
jgi:hypothetical protein